MVTSAKNRFGVGVPKNPNGFTVTELIVCVAVLLTVMTVSTSMFFQTQRIWQDIRHHRIAVSELSNQLDRLTRLTQQELEAELAKLRPSALCAEALRDPELTGVVNDDSVGTRITLKIKWKRRHGEKPITLCGWLNKNKESATEGQP